MSVPLLVTVSQGGRAATGKVVHAVYGEWSYTSGNRSWCGVALSGVESRSMGNVRVTCGNCARVVPFLDRYVMDVAFDVLRRHRLGFRVLGARTLRDLFPGWDLPVAEMAGVILSARRNPSPLKVVEARSVLQWFGPDGEHLLTEDVRPLTLPSGWSWSAVGDGVRKAEPSGL